MHSYPDERHPACDIDPQLNPLPARKLGVAHDVFIGEMPGDPASDHPPGAVPTPTTLEEYLEFALAQGYRGAWPWSFSGTDAYGSLPEEPLRRFAARHPELVNPRAV